MSGVSEQNPDEFEVLSVEQTEKEFTDELLYLADGVTAYMKYCRSCKERVIAINHSPSMYTLNICQEDGKIFGTVRVCPRCVFKILAPDEYKEEEAQKELLR